MYTYIYITKYIYVCAFESVCLLACNHNKNYIDLDDTTEYCALQQL